MSQINSSKFRYGVVLSAVLLALYGCSGDGSETAADGTGTDTGTGTTDTGTGGTTTTAAANIKVEMKDAAGASISKITTDAPGKVTITFKTTAGKAIENAVVSFETDADLGSVTPATVLTDSNGQATTTLSVASLTAVGATTLTGKTQYEGAEVSSSIGYAVGAAAVDISAPVFGVSNLSAYGTTGVSVTVTANGNPVTTPQTVTFTSLCAGSGKAEITPSVATVNGVATASYRDIGCAGTDTIKATVMDAYVSSANIAIAPPSVGSIQFDSATPATIALKGTGGLGRQESAQVVFKVVDQSGNPVGGKTVSFALSTSAGGIALNTDSAVSDPTTGLVTVGVSAGSVSTPVRVLATTNGLSTQSDMLTISTGIPDQRNMSLSATELNVEGWNHDGTETTLNIRMADHFNNPVPDGTVVNFWSEGGSVQPSCTTANGTCSVVWTSQNARPSNGRVTVVAYAVGEEGFVDKNGDGVADKDSELIDYDGNSTDMPEVFLDTNESGSWDEASEPFIDFNNNNVYDEADQKYNGVLCDSSVAVDSTSTACASQKSIHVRDSLQIVMSGSNPAFTLLPAGSAQIIAGGGQYMSVPSCGQGGVAVSIRDLHGNAMPVGSTVEVTSDNGTATVSRDVVPNDSACNVEDPTCEVYGITVKDDGSLSEGVCTDDVVSGTVELSVTTPMGFKTTWRLPVINE